MSIPTIRVVDGHQVWCVERGFISPKSKAVLQILLPDMGAAFELPFDTEAQFIAGLSVAANRLSALRGR